LFWFEKVNAKDNTNNVINILFVKLFIQIPPVVFISAFVFYPIIY